jgi:hypothetical protein
MSLRHGGVAEGSVAGASLHKKRLSSLRALAEREAIQITSAIKLRLPAPGLLRWPLVSSRGAVRQAGWATLSWMD